MRSRSRGVRSLPRWVVWLAHLAQSRHWALVGPFHVVRAPPCVLPRSLAPSGVLGGGRSGPGLPLPGLGLLLRGASEIRGCFGLLPTCCGRGRVGVGAHYGPLGLHALWGLCAVRVVGGGPRGGRPATVVRGVWCQALSLSRPPVLWSGQPGFRDLCVPGAVGAGVGTQHRPHSVLPCGPALLAVGVAEERPRGGVPSTIVRGV